MSQYRVRRFLQADVKCYHCASIVGTVRQEQGAGHAQASFRQSEGGPETALRSLAAVRCTRCHGPLYLDDQAVLYEYPVVDFAAERPRRGRPPKHLAERDERELA